MRLKIILWLIDKVSADTLFVAVRRRGWVPIPLKYYDDHLKSFDRWWPK